MTDPYKGAKKEGGVGFVKGVGRGIFSVPFRVMGGAWSVPAYAMKGLYQEMLKNKGSGVQNYIIAARISQGYGEASTLSPAEKAEIVSAWRNIKTNVKKKKNPGEEQLQALHSYMSEKRERRANKGVLERLRKQENAAGPSDSRLFATENRGSLDLPEPITRSGTTGHGAMNRSPSALQDSIHPLHHAHTYPESGSSHQNEKSSYPPEISEADAAEKAELEAAIKASVAETSRGNPEEDELIARAIRASMNELQRPQTEDETEEEALQRVMKASMEEAQKSGISEEEQRVLEETLRTSMLETSRARRQHGTDSEWDSSDTEDDEDYQRMIEESKHLHDLHSQPEKGDEYFTAIAGTHGAADAQGATRDDNEDEALRKAIEESERAAQEHQSNLDKQRTEEDIVMEYVKKQSLAEEEHRRRMAQGRDTGGESSSGPGVM